MIVIVEDCQGEKSEYKSKLKKEGISSEGIGSEDFVDWIGKISDSDVSAIEAFLIGESERKEIYPKIIRNRSNAPVIALNCNPTLEETLDLFAAGVDDVVPTLTHVREILARAAAIRRRHERDVNHMQAGEIVVFADGRDAIVRGDPFLLPRRERRILEYMVRNQGKRLTKSQVFNAVYGIFDVDVEESVVESHISKLRKKLRMRLGYDPVDSMRFLGYMMKAA